MAETPNSPVLSSGDAPQRKKYVRAVGPRLRVLLYVVFALFALLGANSVYLSSITFLEWWRGLTYQNYFYMVMFGAHLVLGLLIVLPVIVFGCIHIKNSHSRSNRRAVRVGYLLFAIALVLLFSGVALMRFDWFSIKDPRLRSPIYWAHVITPLLAIWVYVLHRLAGPRIKWSIGVKWSFAVGVLVLAGVFMHSAHPKKNETGSVEGTNYFMPSFARTATGKFIPERTLMMDDYCLKCHEDAYKGWFHSSHHFSSFNNEPYFFAVNETRQVSLKRDGNVKASRWCAGCHDVVPFFAGKFDDPNFDIRNDPTAHAGITCTACHAITHVDGTRGNAEYTIDEPIHYPFAYSSNAILQYINNQLVKAKPEFHKKTFLKPVMKSAEFCSTCHKVSLPQELTKYKEFLRGQNHYDTFLLSGVSGHNARSFYYPEKAQQNCNGCHMPLKESPDFAANYFNPTNNATRFIHDHLFPAANTGIPAIRKGVLGKVEGMQTFDGKYDELDDVITVQSNFLRGSLRVDIFGVREGGDISGKLIAPLRPNVPPLKRGQTYLIEVVLRTMRLGHPFSQGTVDSNEIWVDAKVRNGQRTLGRSGGLGQHKDVDPWSHFVNVFMLDRDGNRIDRRNPQDIFTPLYNHQIPPGAAKIAHYSFTVPEDAGNSVTVDVKLNYRKFDTIYMNYVFGKGYTNGAPFQITNELPTVTIASDSLTFPVGVGRTISASPITARTNDAAFPLTPRERENGIQSLGKSGTEVGNAASDISANRDSLSPLPGGEGQGEGKARMNIAATETSSTATSFTITNPPSTIPAWQRWNDYGIGLLLEGTDKGSEKGQLLEAAEAFEQVEKLARYDGPLNLARIYFKEGRLDEAVSALQRASKFDPSAPRWTVAWLNGLVNKQNGYLDKAITEFTSIIEDRYEELDRRGFDFSLDYEVINELGQTLFERAKIERGDDAAQKQWLEKAVARFKRTLEIDTENVTAHYNLALIYERLGERDLAVNHRKLHERYRPDDNARDRAIAIARRRDPAADNAAQATVIYPLQRDEAFELRANTATTPVPSSLNGEREQAGGARRFEASEPVRRVVRQP
ncbi:MAG TPA: tetratricopeptide repeat protein [Candidatus Acidoferrum sp.]|nr:tetratricopeptide repeat protein [Candidatus Acidoferrum sp.]